MEVILYTISQLISLNKVHNNVCFVAKKKQVYLFQQHRIIETILWRFFELLKFQSAWKIGSRSVSWLVVGEKGLLEKSLVWYIFIAQFVQLSQSFAIPVSRHCCRKELVLFNRPLMDVDTTVYNAFYQFPFC